MLDVALVVQDAVSLNRRPHLPPTDSDVADNFTPTDSDAADKDEDVVADTAVALLVSLPDMDPPS